MDVSAVSSSSGNIMDIYAEKVKTESDQVEKLAMISLELKMDADRMEMAMGVLANFYA